MTPPNGAQSPAAGSSVSVIVPTHQRVHLLARTLATVLSQTVAPDEVVVVVDGSNDGTIEWLASFRDPRIRTIVNELATGVSAARNAGIAAATGRWVAFVDDDDLWAPDKLELQLAALAKDPSARWCATGAVNVDADFVPFSVHVPDRLEQIDHQILRGNVIPGGGSGVLAERELVLDVGGFDTDLAMLADWDLWIRLGLRSPVAVASRPMVIYLVHESNMSRDQRRGLHEFELIAQQYRGDAAQRGIDTIGDMTLEWIARWQARCGAAPLRTASMFAGLAIRQRRPKLLVRSIMTLAGAPARRLDHWRAFRAGPLGVDDDVARTVTDAAITARQADRTLSRSLTRCRPAVEHPAHQEHPEHPKPALNS